MSSALNQEASPSRHEVWKMFDRIAPRYDVLNRALSMRQDVTWRKKMTRYLPDGEDLELLDLATGTADQILFLLKSTKRIKRAVGMDLSEGMLAVGEVKVGASPWKEQIQLQVGNTMDIPAEDASFDVATISFGIRNASDVNKGLTEMHRVLRTGGRALILECSVPGNPFIRALYLMYFRHVLPFVGGLVSGDAKAYKYLNKTVETFPCGQAFASLMEQAGFTHVQVHPQTLGVATIYVGER
ncbi:MAG: demethylmenaquinone methyltransferase/2-methoxy-6-polyprenyl-1,4-benzoquinol methylase [Verrucomicrobiales bacterium]|jgi:demethylmenaquinone methyltransferase/2-methoxy-6-polyprenyl-1,4-benzoquinol methylase